MIDKRLRLGQTAAGRAVQADFAKQHTKYKAKIKAIQRELHATAARDREMEKEKPKWDKQIFEEAEAAKKLRVTEKQLRVEMEEKWRREKRP